MVPPLRKVVSDNPFDRSDDGAAYWAEEVAIEAWIEAGAPSPMAMWERLQAASDDGKRASPKLTTPASVRSQGLASIEDACIYLGGISRDTFDRHVRRRLRIKLVGSRPYIVVESMQTYVGSNACKSLNA